MELATTKSLKSEQSRRKKIAAKKKEIKLWMSTNDVSVMSSNGVSLNMRKRIKKYIKQHHIVEKDIKADVDLKYFLDDNRFATDRIREPLWEYLVKNAAEKSRMEKIVQIYEAGDLQRERGHCRKGRRKACSDDLHNTIGEFECTNTMLTHPNHLKKGDCYGSIQIQNWAARNYMRSYYDPLPTSTGRVRCQTKVEAFALRALDFLRFVQQNLNHFVQLKKLAAADDISPPHQTHNQDDQHSVESWECPKSGLVKLNYSVVWDSVSKKAKMGCVCRDNRGAFMLAGSSCTSPYNDAFLAEASGMAKAIEYCHQNRQNVILQAGIGIVVESDNHDLIDCLNRPLASNERISEILRPILERILNLASNFKPRSFMYCNRHSNTVANRLANHAVDADDPNVSAFREAPPDWLIPALKEDSPDLYTEHDEEMGRNNDFGATSPDAAANDDEDRYAIMAEESQA
ncbi:cyclic nucleotide-gated ion channel 1-like [Rosa sericea]